MLKFALSFGYLLWGHFLCHFISLFWGFFIPVGRCDIEPSVSLNEILYDPFA